MWMFNTEAEEGPGVHPQQSRCAMLSRPNDKSGYHMGAIFGDKFWAIDISLPYNPP